MIRPVAILDTCVLVDILRGKKKDLQKKLERLDIKNCSIADITFYELLCGAEKSENREHNIEAVIQLTDYFKTIPIAAGYEIAAKEKVRLQKEGKSIEDIDLLIGCLCIAEGFPLVTNNRKHMERLSDIQIIDW